MPCAANGGHLKRSSKTSAVVATVTSLALSACDREPKEATSTQPTIPSLPVTYAFPDMQDVMLFTNETGSVVRQGNRGGLWRADGGPNRPTPFEACEADGFACIRGYDDRVRPIVIGDLPPSTARPFPELGLSVLKSRSDGGCEMYVSTPYPANSGAWSQAVEYCTGIGVVRLRVEERGNSQFGLDLKSAKGLLPDVGPGNGPTG